MNEVKLPRLGQGMEAGTIVKWLKAEGDPVEKGDPLYEVDTEKVTQEVEAEVGGVLLRIAVAEGEVPVGATLAWIGEPGEELAAAAPAPEREEAPLAVAGRELAAAAQALQRPPLDARGERAKASPLARRIARERGLDLAGLTGTGPEGRIVAEDVERAVVGGAPAAAPAPALETEPAPAPAAAAPPAEVEVEQLTSIRKTIARRLTAALEAPAFQITMSADMTAALALRARLTERVSDGSKPTVTDILTRICAAALTRHRAVNAHFAGDSVKLFSSANIGIAVAIPKGLVVPVVRECERKTIAEIAAARAPLVERARAGRLQPADLEGGTFTISNLGMYGVEQFVAVLNPPQVAILAAGAVEERPVVRGDELVVRPMMTMTLTCDHRAVDGATAAEFLRTVKDYLEEPGLAL